MGYSVTTPPTSEPITLAEAKEHLNVDFTEDDTLIGAMIMAARTAVENYLDYKLDRKSTRLNSSHSPQSRMPSSA